MPINANLCIRLFIEHTISPYYHSPGPSPKHNEKFNTGKIVSDDLFKYHCMNKILVLPLGYSIKSHLIINFISEIYYSMVSIKIKL